MKTRTELETMFNFYTCHLWILPEILLLDVKRHECKGLQREKYENLKSLSFIRIQEAMAKHEWQTQKKNKGPV